MADKWDQPADQEQISMPVNETQKGFSPDIEADVEDINDESSSFNPVTEPGSKNEHPTQENKQSNEDNNIGDEERKDDDTCYGLNVFKAFVFFAIGCSIVGKVTGVFLWKTIEKEIGV